MMTKPKRKKEFVSLLSIGLDPTTNSFTFKVIVSGEQMHHLKYRSLLGGFVSFQKDKETFFKDLADVLQADIIRQLRELSDDKK